MGKLLFKIRGERPRKISANSLVHYFEMTRASRSVNGRCTCNHWIAGLISSTFYVARLVYLGLYLTLQFSLRPFRIVVPFALMFAFVVTITASTFKMYL